MQRFDKCNGYSGCDDPGIPRTAHPQAGLVISPISNSPSVLCDAVEYPSFVIIISYAFYGVTITEYPP